MLLIVVKSAHQLKGSQICHTVALIFNINLLIFSLNQLQDDMKCWVFHENHTNSGNGAFTWDTVCCNYVTCITNRTAFKVHLSFSHWNSGHEWVQSDSLRIWCPRKNCTHHPICDGMLLLLLAKLVYLSFHLFIGICISICMLICSVQRIFQRLVEPGWPCEYWCACGKH